MLSNSGDPSFNRWIYFSLNIYILIYIHLLSYIFYNYDWFWFSIFYYVLSFLMYKFMILPTCNVVDAATLHFVWVHIRSSNTPRKSYRFNQRFPPLWDNEYWHFQWTPGLTDHYFRLKPGSPTPIYKVF